MAVPKGKVSKARRDKRRSSHWKLAAPGLVKCPKCGALHLPHRMCQECGATSSLLFLRPYCVKIRGRLAISPVTGYNMTMYVCLIKKGSERR